MENHIIPDFFIIGAQKCGTTSFYHWLKNHPQIFMPENKEPHFFANLDLISNKYFAKTLSNTVTSQTMYSSLFASAKDGQLKGEASPSYIWCQGAAEKIYRLQPHAKIIVLLRDPVLRAYSEYTMLVAAGLEKDSFDKAIENASVKTALMWGAGPMYIELGKYGSQLTKYYSTFSKSQIKLFTSSELRKSPRSVVESVADFLGVDSIFWNSFDFSANIHHRGGLPRNSFFKAIINAKWARAIGRVLVPKKMRPMVTERLMIKRGKKEEISLQTKQLIWNICEEEIHLVEELSGRKMPELWITHPKYHKISSMLNVGDS